MSIASSDPGTGYHETVTAFRQELAGEAVTFHAVAGRNRASAWTDDAPLVNRDAYLSGLMAGTYAYTLAVVLGDAARFGAEVQQHLATVADDIITNGDDLGRNADVMPAEAAKDGES